MGCHVEKKLTKTGLETMMASAGTCVKCHTKDHKKMLADWKTELVKEVQEAKEIEQEALDALEDSKAKLSGNQLAEAQRMLVEGRQNIDIVQFGNGVHNKKYSLLLIDAAINKYDELIEYIESYE
jgi:cytochrome c553